MELKIKHIPRNNQFLINNCIRLATKDYFDNLFLLGDLFPPCIDLTDVYGVFDREALISLFTVFKGFDCSSVVIPKSSEETEAVILSHLFHILPEKFILVSPSLTEKVLSSHFRIQEKSSEICMITDRKRENFLDSDHSLIHASLKDLSRIDEFYQANHTFPWSSIQLESNFYFFQEINDQIVACGGTHFETPKLAHLGNVLVISEYRGKSLGKNLVSTIGNEILKTKRFITLFVVQDNVPAIRLYEKLGFSSYKNFTLFSCVSV
ncbi:hypothetical protein CEE45_16140 [Candidatus Heimdallarchaeota archaeon B3_Heim]|nr:MAG: hypothetical protein CEE45_16140 [Candidatus Heimdallarchaeota archaeon B3_Heim]